MDLLVEQDVRELLPLDDAITAVEREFEHEPVEEGQLIRRRIRLGGTRLNVLGGSSQATFRLVVKAYTGGANFAVLLFGGDGTLLAVIEAKLLSLLRTAAATGVATKWMSAPDSSRVGLLGSGYQAKGQLRAICLVRPIRSALVWSPTRSHASAFASEMSAELDIDVGVVDSPQLAVADVDVVVTATKSNDPIVDGRWLRAGTHVNLIGANQRHRREGDEHVISRRHLVVVDDPRQARLESGELIDAIEAGALDWEDVASLHEIVRGILPGRSGPDDITVFKSLGVALEDVAVASLVYDRWKERWG